MIKLKRSLLVAALAALMLGGGAAAAVASPATVVDPSGVRHTVIGKPAGKAGKKGQAHTDTIRTLTGTYWYAGGHQAPATAADGAVANVEVPTVTVTAGDHSLVELDVEQGSGSTRDIVEIGFNKDNPLYGDNNVHLFVFAWKQGVGQGYNGGGGYTALGGGCATAGQTETAGTTVKLSILHGGTAPNTGWFLYRGACSFGYYPDTTWTAPAFTSSTYNQAFGEVWDAAGAGTTTTDMGNGVLPTATTGAVIGSYLLGTQPSGNVNLTWFKTTPGGLGTKWNVLGLSARTGRYGGPG